MIELMIVVAIIGISAMAINFSFSPANARLKRAALDLFSSLQSIRFEAIKRNHDWGIICDNGTDTYALCSYDTATSSCNGANTTITLADYDSSIQFGLGEPGEADNCTGTCPSNEISYTSPDDIAYFTPRGLSPNLGWVYLQNDKKVTYRIGTTSLAGVVKLSKFVCQTRRTDAEETCKTGYWE